MDSEADRIRAVILGKIVGAWGVRGWVKVLPYTRLNEEILAYRQWRIGPELQACDVIAGKRHGTGIIAQLEGVATRDQALELVGREISVAASELPKPGDGEYYWTDLEGLQVITPQGGASGIVEKLFETGANDVMVVRLGDREVLVPWISDVVRNVDLARGIIEVDWDFD